MDSDTEGGRGLSRSYSDKFLEGSSDSDLLLNKNQNWTSSRSFIFAYLFGVLVVWFVCHTSQIMSDGDCWTATNVFHFVVRWTSLLFFRLIDYLFDLINRLLLSFFIGFADLQTNLHKENIILLLFMNKLMLVYRGQTPRKYLC